MVFFTFNQKRYIGEIKYGKDDRNGNFWRGLKVLGYLELYKWQYRNVEKIFPAILMPLEDINLTHQVIAKKLKITLFGIIEVGKKFDVKRIE